MLNYTIDPAILRPLVPVGTELDMWRDEAYISLVGFRFLNTRIKNVRFPFHSNFEEVNLRFYVRRKHGAEWRRGVVFVKEIVPRPAIAAVARLLYNENYISLPTRHNISSNGELSVRYEWCFLGKWNHVEAVAQGDPKLIEKDSEEEFIAEHYWGYTGQRDGGTKEYRVEHPSWRVWRTTDASLEVDIAGIYGKEFESPLKNPPTSAFIAEGSKVTVSKGSRLQ